MKFDKDFAQEESFLIILTSLVIFSFFNFIFFQAKQKGKLENNSFYIANRYWNSKSYGIFSTVMDILTLLWLLKQSTIDFLSEPDVGNCWQTHWTKEFISIAKSNIFLSRSSGNAIFFVLVTTTEACRYSSFDFSSSAATPSAVYILTCRRNLVRVSSRIR